MGEGIVPAHAVVPQLVQPDDVARVLADEVGAVLLVDRLGDGAVVARAPHLFLGLAPADDAALGFDPHQRAVKRADLSEVGDVLLLFGDGDVQPGGLDGFDAH